MLEIKFTNAFKKDFKQIQKRNLKIALLNEVINILCEKEELPQKYTDHPLQGKYSGYRDCHIQPDWILIYRIEENFLYLLRTGTHSDLF